MTPDMNKFTLKNFKKNNRKRSGFRDLLASPPHPTVAFINEIIDLASGAVF